MSRKLAYDIKDIVNSEKEFYSSKQPTETTVNIRTEKKRIPLPQNVMVFQAFAYLSATKLKPSTNRILMLLFSKSAYENYIGMDVKTMSEELDMSERSVLRGLNELEVNNIIIKLKHPSDKRRHDYFINPSASWKGNSYTRKKMLESIPQNQLDLFQEQLPKQT